jgi:uncharacterized caspase-like protein
MSVRLQHLFFIAVASAMLTFSALSQERPPRVALVIGNASYPDASSPLSTTIGDARAMAEEFRGNNFDVDLKENAGNEDMRRAVDAFLSKIRSGASALLYFNGIGIQVGRQTYLIPVNAQISSEAGVRRDGISVDATLAEMHRRGAKVKIVILDAARRNPFEARFRTSAAGLAAIDAPEGTIAIYSAAPGRVIADGAGANSLFAAELIKELRVPNRTAEEAFNRTRISVSRASNNEQVPWVATSLVEQFSLAPASPQVATTPAPAPAPPSDPEAQARRDYEAAERAGTRRAFEDFIARYPFGRHSDLARDRLAKLAAPAAPPKPAETAAAPAPPPLVAPTPTTPPAVVPPPATPPPVATTPPPVKTPTTPPPVASPAPAPPPVAPPTTPPPVASTQPVQPMQPTPPAPPGADDPAIRELDRRIQANPNDIAAYYKRGQLYAQHGAYRRAIEDFDTAIRLNPKDAEALNNRCWTRAVVGDLQSALKDCDDALQIRPGYVDAFDSRGFVNLKMSKPRNAITDYDAALKINPRHASALYGRGLAKIQTGNATGGNSDIAAAKRIQPDIVDEFASYGVR